jgi:hypothetical protein
VGKGKARQVGAQHAAPLQTTDTLRLTALLADFRLLLILFVGLRLTLLLVYQPLMVNDIERGMTAGGDFNTYFSLSSLTPRVGPPYSGWWSEFPPVWPLLSSGIYAMSRGSYMAFAMLAGIAMVIFDAGNLILIRKIAGKLYGENTAMSLAWVYALLPAPLVLVWWTFEPLVAFWLLLGLWWLLAKRDVPSAAAGAVGALTKFTPALLLAAAWRFRDVRTAVRYTLILLGIFVLAYVPLLAGNAAMTLPSLTAQFNKASYETVWALIDGNTRTGNFGPLEDRLDPAKANAMLGNPARVPGWLRFGIAAAVGLFVFVRARRLDNKGLVAFTTIALLIFFLQAQGWSPQWLAQIVPLLLLCFPSRNGIFAVLMLNLLVFAEYPFLFIRTGDTGGAVTGALVMPFALLVLARTALLAGACVALYRILRQEPVPDMN